MLAAAWLGCDLTSRRRPVRLRSPVPGSVGEARPLASLGDGRPSRRREARAPDARRTGPSRSAAGSGWFDAGDNNNAVKRTRGSSYGCRSPAASSKPGSTARMLVIRTRKPTVTVAHYLDDARKAELIGKSLAMGDADINYASDQAGSGPRDRALALEGLLVARRLLERGQPCGGPPLRPAPRRPGRRQHG